MTTAETNPLAPVAPALDVDPVYEIALWVATCSNRSRTVAECGAFTDALFEKLAKASVIEDRTMRWVAGHIVTVFMNRGNDVGFVDMMFAYDRPRIARGCVETLIDAIQHSVDAPIQTYIDAYVERYGETREILTVKLRWLTMFTHYPDNVAEVERILGILNGTTEAA